MPTPIADIDPQEEIPSFPETYGAKPRALDYLGYAPCPIRQEMQRQLHQHFRRHEAEFGPVEWFSPNGCGGDDPYDLVWQNGTEESLPGLISDGGNSDFFKPEAHRRWIESGILSPIATDGLEVRPELAEAGIVDPCGGITIYGAFPSVLLVDHDKLKGRPAPRSWQDLLDPIYQGDVTIAGHHGRAPDVLLFNTWKNHGDEGVKALARNVAEFSPPARMAKIAGLGSPQGTAVYVLNGFFAKAVRGPAAEVIWPEEGAWFNPLMLLAKRSRRPASDLALRYLLGPEWAAYIESVGIPFAYRQPGQQPLPGRLSWMGWDFIRSHDLDTLRDDLLATFNAAAR